MLSWWVGLSPEEFYREIRQHAFSRNWKANWVPAEEAEWSGMRRSGDKHQSGREAIHNLQAAGFVFNDLRSPGFNVSRPSSEDKNLEPIPYWEWNI